jgi:hypothetical protein
LLFFGTLDRALRYGANMSIPFHPLPSSPRKVDIY